MLGLKLWETQHNPRREVTALKHLVTKRIVKAGRGSAAVS